MKPNWFVKLLAVLLCAAAIVMIAASGVIAVSLARVGLYERTPEEYLESTAEQTAYRIGNYLADCHIQKLSGTIPQELTRSSEMYFRLNSQSFYWEDVLREGSVRYRLRSEAGSVLEQSDALPEDTDRTYLFVTVPVAATQYVRITPLAGQTDTPEGTDEGDDSEALAEVATVPANGAFNGEIWGMVGTDGIYREYGVTWLDGPGYTVDVWLDRSVALDSQSYAYLSAAYEWRYAAVAVMLAGIVIFLASGIYLGWASGRKSDGTVCPGGLNRLPLDVYLCGAGVTAGGIFYLAETILEKLDAGWLAVIFTGGAIFLAGLVGVGLYCAIAAQIKVHGGYWWRHCVIGGCLVRCGRLLRRCVQGIGRLFSMLPLIWQWLLLGCGLLMALGLGVLLALADYMSFFGILLLLAAILLWVAAVCGGGYAFGVLYGGAKRMSRGELDSKIPTEHLRGSFRDFAVCMNSLADAAVESARNQVKSERFKAELITNVSHDLKTPLTSIINYVDLLRRDHTEEQERLYLDVLLRQSQRMKKLIEDLMEMSKASTGNVQTDIRVLDAVETVNQALGEFADKLTAAGLTVVFPQPDMPLGMWADGRLAWRVLSNVLSNAVKYALPGTRLYVDVRRQGKETEISLKNISREQLNISAQELMERFVRGDASRNTEGSGLGLNIAQSLMELQHGRLDLLVDGDLFKVTLTFPGAELTHSS